MNKDIQEPEINNETSFWDLYLDRILDQDLLNKIIKFHQSSTYIKRENKNNPYSLDVLNWLMNVERTDIKPNMYISEHDLEDFEYNNKGSIREFNLDKELTYSTLSRVIKKSFGRSGEFNSKRHPSAGALYPVIPLICILKNQENQLTKGVYIYDSYRNSLKKIKEWDKEEFNDLIGALTSWDNKVYSNYFIGYAIDLKRAIAKYKERGYRHALIELGTMSQSFKESLLEEQPNTGEFISSGFDDNALSYYLGLNPRICPVTLVQWFGERRDIL